MASPGDVTAAARLYAAEMGRLAPGKPLRTVVYSHDHADHASGAPTLFQAFAGPVPIVGHENAYAKLAGPTGDPNLPPPTLTFADRMTIGFGGRPIELHYLGKSHSDNLIVAYLPEDRFAFAVDFVANEVVGFRDLPDYHFPDFFETLERLQRIPYERIVFGQGPPGDRASVERQVRYYRELREAVSKAVAQGMSEDEAAGWIQLASCHSGGGTTSGWGSMCGPCTGGWLEGVGREGGDDVLAGAGNGAYIKQFVRVMRVRFPARFLQVWTQRRPV